MKYLLDTHVLLWVANDGPELSREALAIVDDAKNQLFFSPASLWEIAIKRGLGRPDFQVDPRVLHRGLVENGFEELPISSQHTLAVDGLPPIHKDPFDRILIAQATMEGLVLLTADQTVALYPGPIQRI